MKRTVIALTLALAVLLSGCVSMLQRSYSSATDHTEYAQTDDSNLLRAETYRGLVDAILYFVNAHTGQGLVRLYNYTGDVEADLEAACQEVLREDPLAAFAVEDISFECSRIVSYYEAAFTLRYSHNAQEVEAIRFASGSAALRQALGEAIASFSPSLVLRLSYFPEDAEAVRAMATQIYYNTPQAAFGMPELQITVYPESGVQRIVEIGLQWPQARSALTARSGQLLSLAQELLGSNPPAEGQERHTPESLALLLREAAAPMDPAGSDDPYSALSGESATQLAHTLALELLLQLSGLTPTFASGQTAEGGACWLVVNTESGWRHLLLTDEELLLCTDRSLTELGYQWDTQAYPPCVDPEEDLSRESPPPPEEDSAAPDN